MKNVKELRDALCETFVKIQNDKISLKKARELAYNANTILNSVKTEIRGNEVAGIHAKVSFLIYDEAK